MNCKAENEKQKIEEEKNEKQKIEEEENENQKIEEEKNEKQKIEDEENEKQKATPKWPHNLSCWVFSWFLINHHWMKWLESAVNGFIGFYGLSIIGFYGFPP